MHSSKEIFIGVGYSLALAVKGDNPNITPGPGWNRDYGFQGVGALYLIEPSQVCVIYNNKKNQKLPKHDKIQQRYLLKKDKKTINGDKCVYVEPTQVTQFLSCGFVLLRMRFVML